MTSPSTDVRGALVGAIGAIAAATIIAGAGLIAAETFEPAFVTFGPFVLNIDHIAEVRTSASGRCTIIMTTESERPHFSDQEDECLELKQALSPYISPR